MLHWQPSPLFPELCVKNVDEGCFRFTFYQDGKLSKKPHRMSFTYRVPSWCKAGEPGFHTQTNDWKSGDVFTLELPMEVTFEDNAVRGRSVVLGPLVYSYSIPASCTEDNAIYDNLAGKKSANPDFKSEIQRHAALLLYARRFDEPLPLRLLWRPVAQMYVRPLADTALYEQNQRAAARPHRHTVRDDLHPVLRTL